MRVPYCRLDFQLAIQARASATLAGTSAASAGAAAAGAAADLAFQLAIQARASATLAGTPSLPAACCAGAAAVGARAGAGAGSAAGVGGAAAASGCCCCLAFQLAIQARASATLAGVPAGAAGTSSWESSFLPPNRLPMKPRGLAAGAAASSAAGAAGAAGAAAAAAAALAAASAAAFLAACSFSRAAWRSAALQTSDQGKILQRLHPVGGPCHLGCSGTLACPSICLLGFLKRQQKAPALNRMRELPAALMPAGHISLLLCSTPGPPLLATSRCLRPPSNPVSP